MVFTPSFNKNHLSRLLRSLFLWRIYNFMQFRFLVENPQKCTFWMSTLLKIPDFIKADP